MAHNKRKAIFYPDIESIIITYYQNITTLLLGALGVKYGTSNPTKTEISNSNNAMPDALQKAYDDAQVAQQSTEAKDKVFHDGKSVLLRELQRITKLDNWDEDDGDGEVLGIRVEKVKPDPNTVQPTISNTSSLPEEIEIDWVKRGQAGVVIFGSYDGASYEEIGRDLKSPFEDKRSNQTPGVPETRWYKLRYHDADVELIGIESNPVKVIADIS